MRGQQVQASSPVVGLQMSVRKMPTSCLSWTKYHNTRRHYSGMAHLFCTVSGSHVVRGQKATWFRATEGLGQVHDCTRGRLGCFYLP